MFRIFKGPGIILQTQWDSGVQELSSGIFFPVPQLCFLCGPCSQTGPQSMAPGPECGGGGENLQKENRSSVARRREVWADKNNRSSLCSCAHFVDFIDVKVSKNLAMLTAGIYTLSPLSGFRLFDQQNTVMVMLCQSHSSVLKN